MTDQPTYLRFATRLPPWLRRLIASDFVQKVAETFSARVFTIVLGLVSSVLIARMLGPEGRGIFAAASTMTAIIVQFGNLGLHASNTYYIAQDRDALPILTGNSLLVSFGLGGILVTGAMAIFTIDSDLAPVHGIILVLALFTVPFGIAETLLQNLLLGLYEVRKFNIIIVGSKILGVVLLLAIWFFDLVSVEVVYATGVVVLLFNFGWSFQQVTQHLPRLPIVSWAVIRQHIGYGLRAYIAALFAFLVIRFDLLMVQYIRGAEDLGYYSLAATMGDMMYMLPVAVGTILFPRLSAMPDQLTKWRFTKRVALITCGVMVGVSIIALGFAHPAVQILYGSEFLPAVPAFRWLVLAIFLLSVNTIFMNYFASIGMPTVAIYSPAAAAALNVLANLYLMPQLGIVGTAVASVLAYGLMLMFSITYIFLNHKKRDHDEQNKRNQVRDYQAVEQ